MIDDQFPQQRPSNDDIPTNLVIPSAFLPMDEASARDFLRWRYAPPYDMYNIGSDEDSEDDINDTVGFFIDPQSGYYSVLDQQGQLVAFCCVGWDAQVPGGDYHDDALDLGIQLRPDLVEQPNQELYVEALLYFARRSFSPKTFRTTIAAWDTTALRGYEQAGFQSTQTFQDKSYGRSYVVLTRPA